MSERRWTLLVAAMGGEGGGVLSQWIAEVLEGAGYLLQSTASPGVAQRTGATTYYIEALKAAEGSPVFSLLPLPGKIDVALATELAEVGRLIEKGYITPTRTLLIGSTHRVFATSEKVVMDDGRMAEAPVKAAAAKRARQLCLTDFAKLAEAAGAIINAPVFGAFARLNPFGLPREAFEAALRREGQVSLANERGFDLGWRAADGEEIEGLLEAEGALPQEITPALTARIAAFAPELQAHLALCAARLLDYQGPSYAALFFDRLQAFQTAPSALVSEVARALTLWMAFNDIARVAQLKLSPQRLKRIAGEAKLTPGDKAEIVDFFKPGPEELAALLPPTLGRRLRAWAAKKNRTQRLSLAIHLKTSSLTGQVLLRFLRGLRRWRPRGERYHHEQANIERWLANVKDALARDAEAALEVADCARLLKGYGETWTRGARAFETISRALPLILSRPQPARVLAGLKAAALADPEGKGLTAALKTFDLTESPS